MNKKFWESWVGIGMGEWDELNGKAGIIRISEETNVFIMAQTGWQPIEEFFPKFKVFLFQTRNKFTSQLEKLTSIPV